MPLTEAEELELLELEAQEAQSQPQGTSNAEVVGRGLAQGATLGFGDELSALAEKGIAKASQVTGIGPQDVAQRTLAAPTEQLIQENRQEIKETEQANPGLSLASKVVGGLPSAIATAGFGAPGLVATGAVAGAGEAEGDISDRLDDALIGGAIGYALPKGLSAAGSKLAGGLNLVGNGLRSLAQRLSTKAIQLKDISGLDQKALAKVGDMLLDQKITSRPAMLSMVGKRLKEVTNKVGTKVKTMYGLLDDKVGLEDQMSKDDILQNLQSVVGADAKTGSFSEAVVSEVRDVLSAPKWAKTEKFKPKQLLEVIQDIESEGQRFTSKVPNPELENKRNALITASKSLRKNLKELAAKYFPEKTPEFHEALETFTVLKRAQGEVDNALRSGFKSSGGQGVSLDQIAKGVTAPLETVAKTTAAGTANFAAKVLGYSGKGAQYLKDAAKRGPHALNVASYVLSQQSPEFKEYLGENDDE